MDGRNTLRRVLSMLLYLKSTGPYGPNNLCLCPHRSSRCASECSQMFPQNRHIFRAFVKVQIVRTTTEGVISVVTDGYNSFCQLQNLPLNLKSHQNHVTITKATPFLIVIEVSAMVSSPLKIV